MLLDAPGGRACLDVLAKSGMAAESAPAVKSKKRKKEKAEKAETAAEPQSAKAQPAGSGSKRRKKVKAPVTPEEEARRQKQRECRELALAARGSGKEYLSAYKVRAKKRPLQAQRKYERRQQGQPSKAERNTERRAAQMAAKAAAKAERLKAPTVIIVPIFWKGEADQMALVLSVCADVKKALEELTLTLALTLALALTLTRTPTLSLSPSPTVTFSRTLTRRSRTAACVASSTRGASTHQARSLRTGSIRASSCAWRWARERRRASDAHSRRRSRRACLRVG